MDNWIDGFVERKTAGNLRCPPCEFQANLILAVVAFFAVFGEVETANFDFFRHAQSD